MGILDEAIREHLELKRQHGAAEPELKQLEDEALGAPGEIEQPPEMSDAEAEAPTDYIGSPAATVPEQEEAGTAEVPEAAAETAPPAPDLRPPEMRPEEPPPPDAAKHAEDETGDPAEEPADDEAPAEEEHPAMELEVPDAEQPEANPEPAAEPPEAPIVAGGVSADLRAEREEIAQHPTEHYDVEDEIAEAEKEAAGFFNEQSLSDELDQALDSPDLPAGDGPAEAIEEVEVIEESAEAEVDEPEEAPEVVEVVEEEEVEVVEEEQPGPEDEASDAEEGEEDVLEETPEFLQDSPEHDRLWFEQKPPKDFDFDD